MRLNSLLTDTECDVNSIIWVRKISVYETKTGRLEVMEMQDLDPTSVKFNAFKINKSENL